MSPDQRAEIETQVERSVRRGELGLAREGLQRLVAAFPADAALALRLADLEAHALPGELTARPPPTRPLTPPPDTGSAAHVVEGERLFQRGDFAGAVSAYRQALREQPNSELLHERLAELFRIAQAQGPAETAPRAGAATASPAPRARGDESDRSPLASPDGRVAALEQLLSRIAARRRSGT